MYIPFQDSTFVPLESGDVPAYELGEVSVPQVSATSALTSDGDLVVALVNLHARDAIDVSVSIDSFDADSASGRVLTGNAIDAHNTFDDPDAIRPARLELDLNDGKLRVSLPARSVSVIRLEN
jgi:alpha-N-arabinofuranosidase